MNAIQALQSLSGYPIPRASIINMAEEAGLDPLADIGPADRKSSAFKKAKAQVYSFLAEAPNISQAGISFTFSAEERKRFQMKAQALLEEAGDAGVEFTDYGYKGEDF